MKYNLIFNLKIIFLKLDQKLHVVLHIKLYQHIYIKYNIKYNIKDTPYQKLAVKCKPLKECEVVWLYIGQKIYIPSIIY